jgi:hypothetical protein
MELKYEILLNNENLEVKYLDGTVVQYKLEPLPNEFLKWQSEARLNMFKRIQREGVSSIKSMPAHLPVLGTIGKEHQFINLASKGLGLLPKKEKLEEFFNLFRQVKESSESKDWKETIKERMESALKFYKNVANFNPYFLGGLEIFEGQTADNLREKPLAALLYTGTAPKFLSYQFNGIIDIVQGDNLYYQFLLSARELFAFDAFHVKQVRYPFGYLFYTINIREKTPFSRK